MTTPTLLPDIDSESEQFVLVKLMDDALDAVIDAYTVAGVSLPERRYWTLAGAAGDGEQLTVSLVQAYFGVPNEQVVTPTRCTGPRTVVLAVQILRCIPVVLDDGTAPSSESIQAASARQAVDMWLLMDSVDAIVGQQPAIATVDAGRAQGGLQGVTLSITTQV